MNFAGHQTYKINKNWLFDLTEFTGYKVHLDRHGKVVDFEKAYKVTDKHKNGEMKFNRFIDSIPLGVLRKTELIIKAYYKESSMYGDADR